MATTADGISKNTPAKGKLVTVLSIDGGGVRGIIPATILAFLELELQVRQTTPPLASPQYTPTTQHLYCNSLRIINQAYIVDHVN